MPPILTIVTIASASASAYCAVFFATYRPVRLASKAMTLLCTALALDRFIVGVLTIVQQSPLRTVPAYHLSIILIAAALLMIIVLIARRQMEPL